MLAALETGYDLNFAHDVATGLKAAQKNISASWLYDELGSTLFEAITLLPEYGLTRADGELLRRCSHEAIRAAKCPPIIIELGSGTGTKTRHLLEAAAERKPVRYIPIDISESALRSCETALGDIHDVRIEAIAATYFNGLSDALALRHSSEPALILFLGSTIGNFSPTERAEFLQEIRKSVSPGDSLLLGTDLVKPREVLVRAYDDSLGVTAAFNRNLLVRINRELGGNFNVSAFAHEARYNERHSRIEMHLRSLQPQQVYIEKLNLRVSFREGETIWTESCHKFQKEQVSEIGARAGWSTAAQWIDTSWGFAETLLAA